MLDGKGRNQVVLTLFLVLIDPRYQTLRLLSAVLPSFLLVDLCHHPPWSSNELVKPPTSHSRIGRFPAKAGVFQTGLAAFPVYIKKLTLKRTPLQ